MNLNQTFEQYKSLTDRLAAVEADVKDHDSDLEAALAMVRFQYRERGDELTKRKVAIETERNKLAIAAAKEVCPLKIGDVVMMPRHRHTATKNVRIPGSINGWERVPDLCEWVALAIGSAEFALKDNERRHLKAGDLFYNVVLNRLDRRGKITPGSPQKWEYPDGAARLAKGVVRHVDDVNAIYAD